MCKNKKSDQISLGIMVKKYRSKGIKNCLTDKVESFKQFLPILAKTTRGSRETTQKGVAVPKDKLQYIMKI